jgi:hypothetical protein
MRDLDVNSIPLLRLNDIAAQFGDGLVPELYDLLVRLEPPTGESAEVIALSDSLTTKPTQQRFISGF